jgi:TRAP-type C4-dicarboxylate transport system permease large subunit/TRAP-type C4-dicarboxylate transport system permease small subunit
VPGKLARFVHPLEDSLALLALFLLAVFPVFEVIAREFFQTGVPGSTDYAQHLVLVATFIAGGITSRQKRHLSLAVDFRLKPRLKEIVQTTVQVLCAGVAIAFSWSALSFALNGFEASQKIGVIPLRLVVMVMVLGYLVMGLRFITGLDSKRGRWLWLAPAAAFGSFLAFSSIVQIGAALSASPPAFLTSLAGPLQSVLAGIASPLIVILVISAFFGSPIFIVLGGAGYLLFARQGLPLEVVPNQAYAMLTGYAIAAIPLFTLTGFILSESKAGERLIKLFKAFFSWIPGGLAVMAIIVCAFFSTFTGASGVTIVALGGLLYYILVNGGYSRVFSVGLLTASGSIGLLFPPSLPVIIYGVTTQVSIKEMFIGGILPGTAMVLTVVAIAVVYALKAGVERVPFNPRETLASFRESVWEILLPVIIFIGYFGLKGPIVKRFAAAIVFILVIELLTRLDTRRREPTGVLMIYLPVSAVFAALVLLPSVGWLTIGIAAAASAGYGLALIRPAHPASSGRGFLSALARFGLFVAGLLALLAAASSVSLSIVESAAVAVIYALIAEMLIHRDLKIRDLPKTLGKSLPIIGGVLTILPLANALSYYIIDAEIPVKLTTWVQAAISSKYVFLLILNLALLVVGCFLDIYSAILVVVPLIVPLGNLFQIHPVHLGIIFLANLELGYLTPPVGINLYLASYRFNEPLVRIYKDVQMFLLFRLATVLLITYVPFLTLALLRK